MGKFSLGIESTMCHEATICLEKVQKKCINRVEGVNFIVANTVAVSVEGIEIDSTSTWRVECNGPAKGFFGPVCTAHPNKVV